jgi:hypothetical protein
MFAIAIRFFQIVNGRDGSSKLSFSGCVQWHRAEPQKFGALNWLGYPSDPTQLNLANCELQLIKIGDGEWKGYPYRSGMIQAMAIISKVEARVYLPADEVRNPISKLAGMVDGRQELAWRCG